jgi:hypothetical protein
VIVIVGLVILIAAVIVGVGGVLGNAGHAHALSHGFALFGYHVTGSTGTLFLYGIVVGAIAVLGLSLLLAGARRTSRRGHAARRGLKQSRSETAAASRDRDSLIAERDTARAETAAAQPAAAVPADAPAEADAPPGEDDPTGSVNEATDVNGSADVPADRSSRWQRFGHRPAPRQALDTDTADTADAPVAAE